MGGAVETYMAQQVALKLTKADIKNLTTVEPSVKDHHKERQLSF